MLNVFNRSSVALRTFVCVFFFSTLCITPPLGAMAGMPGFENLSPEEMQQLEQELQAAAQQIDAYVGSLSPEEQAEFQKAVQEVEQMMSSMNEEELNQFFEQIIAAEMEQAQMQQGMPPTQAQPAPVTFEQKPAPAVSKVPLTSAEEKALALLTSLIDATDKLLLKTDNIHEMVRFFRDWTRSGKVTGVIPGTTWQEQRNSIDALRQQVSDLKKTDLKTGKYLFIEALTKNSTLYGQLEQLNQQLTLNEPRFIVSNFGFDDTSKKGSKSALQACLSAYGATLQSTKTDIKKLFDEIGPELAKIKEEEKKVTEKAQTEAAKGRQVTPGRTAGAADMSGYYGGGRNKYDDYDYGSPYGKDYGYGDYGRPSAARGGESAADKGKDKGKGGGGKSAKGGGKGKEDDKKDSKFDKDKDKKDKDKQDKDKDKKQDQAERDAKKADKLVVCPADGGEQLNGKLELIASNYRYITDLLQAQENAAAANIDALLKDKNPNPHYALYLFPTLERRLNRLNELITDYKKYVATAKDLDNAKKDAALEKLVALHKDQQFINRFYNSLETTMAQLDDAETSDEFIRTMTPNARYAYFKDELKLQPTKTPEEEVVPLKAADAKLKDEFKPTNLSSLKDIFKKLQTLNASIPVKKKDESKKVAPEKTAE